MTSKTVLITGAAKRIGATLARNLHEDGMNIVVHYKSSQQAAKELVDSLNGNRPESAMMVQANLLDTDCFNELVSSASELTGRLDVLVNNASTFYPTQMGHTSPKQWMDLTGTNMMAPYFLAQACQDLLKANAGCIVNITDIYAQQPLKDHPVYSASKAGLVMLTRAMAMELGPDIRVNAVSPGAILWPDNQSEDKQQEILSQTLLQRKGDPKDITNAVRFLIENAGYITGQVINVDGGRL